ncbi:ATP-binding protein [Fodinicurvata fenggangensis]|uniref:ATP-binding protein n=1 Tax=Fodinicurvata fenggangensis TaxID=1121830 RepID=UPI00047D0D48|nr:ATP-binding protein [Fodinicurvata fenggangensis]
MVDDVKVADEFDLQPDPRILPMLGEINLDHWRCIAELVDNSIDGFLNSAREGETVETPEVYVDLPKADKSDAVIQIRDNGPGMTPETLQRAVSAGWSGNNPIDNLGLFGMGFNIATARLGTVTQVWTTTNGESEWHGLEIDFQKLRKQRHFRTAHLRHPKQEPKQHGTVVMVKHLKPEQRTWLAKSTNHSQLRKRLSQVYSSMLRRNGVPITFKLFVSNKIIHPYSHCVWDENRSVTLPDVGEVPAVIHFDHTLTDRPYCINCMNWVSLDESEEKVCPICSSHEKLTHRRRRVHGWIGIQRYLDKTEFGFDLIRNGRKIEINNKDLFVWQGEEGEESEYPIDDQRGRGRLVGEIHIDHCRVSYAKDRFDRADQSWNEMVRLIRGDGPLRPEKAKSLGYGPNDSPLFKLFKAFRRTSPQSKVAGAWQRIMVVKDNERAKEMARYFHDGHPDYQDDAKWWELIEEEDRRQLYDARQKGKGEQRGDNGETDDPDFPEGILDDSGEDEQPAPEQSGEEEVPQAKPRTEVPSLSRKYIHASSGVQWTVKAFTVDSLDPELPWEAPWTLVMGDPATRTYHFLYYQEHKAFRSLTLTPLDALLLQLAIQTVDFTNNRYTLPATLTELRETYGGDSNLNPKEMQLQSAEMLSLFARGFAQNCPEDERSRLFNEISSDEKQKLMRNLAARKVQPDQVTNDGSFLEYAPYETLESIIDSYPEYCFDGKVWDDAYETLDYGDASITNSAREATRERYKALLRDVIWLARQEGNDFSDIRREELVRSLMSLRLLWPDAEVQ